MAMECPMAGKYNIVVGLEIPSTVETTGHWTQLGLKMLHGMLTEMVLRTFVNISGHLSEKQVSTVICSKSSVKPQNR